MNVWANIAAILKTGEPCALVTVAKAEGSTPREAGARLVVTGDERFFGTIGGGTLELEAIRRAAGNVRSGLSGFCVETVSLGPDLGQCCGGRVDIAIEVLATEKLAQAERLAAHETLEEVFATRATVSGKGVGPRTLLKQIPDCRYSLDNEIAGAEKVLAETFGSPRRPVCLFGAGHVGKALILALAPLPFQVTWIDSRPDQFPGVVPANVKMISQPSPADLLDQAPDNAFVLAMTHSHALDEEIMARALLRQRFAYCGVIGSKTKRNRFRTRLKARGLNETLIANMVCPVGNPSIKSKHPAAIAAGVATDLLLRDEALHQQAAAGEGLAQNIPHGQ